MKGDRIKLNATTNKARAMPVHVLVSLAVRRSPKPTRVKTKSAMRTGIPDSAEV